MLETKSLPPKLWQPKPPSFFVYIDESGDDGFRFEKGSSQWFVLSAAIIRAENGHEMGEIVADTINRLGRLTPAPLHFQKMRHEHRLPFVDRIASSSVKTSTVAVYKPRLDASRFTGPSIEKHQLYRYIARILIERVSWFCRDHRKAPNEWAKIIFSNRSSMSYDAIRNYFGFLKSMGPSREVRIEWSVIKPAFIIAKGHEQMHGLEIADAVAGSLWYATQESKYGFAEPRYAQLLSPTMYRHNGKLDGYGLKVMPTDGATKAKLEKDLKPLMGLLCN